MGIEALTSPRAFIGAFYNRLSLSALVSVISRIAMRVESTQAEENYKWLGSSPAMREWVGPRLVKGLRDNGFAIKNKTFEATLGVSVDDVRRDQTGQSMVRISELATRTANHPVSLLSQIIVAGAATVCYDGQYFYDTDHAEGDSGAQSNKTTSPGAVPAAPTSAEYEKAILGAVQQILGIKDDQGEPMNDNAKSFLVMVPAGHFAAASAALKNPVLVTSAGAAITNTLATLGGFTIELAVNPRLTATTKFTVHRTDGDTKPFIYQVELEPQVQFNDKSFEENQWEFGVKAIHNVGFGFWQQSCEVTFV